MKHAITLIRMYKEDNATLGELYFDGHRYFTLEPKWRDLNAEKKVAGETAIPEGTYKISLYKSPKRRYEVPLLKGVPGFSGIEIHIGNTVKDTLGCILIGKTMQVGMNNIVLQSRDAFEELMKLIKADIKKGNEIEIAIK